jgi:isoquinoline 1-oxidoreductase beta subunit
MPFLAHATMEPMNCTVHVTPNSCEVWIGTQAIARVQQYAAKAAGLLTDKVTVHQHLLGGGFGRRLEADMAESAVRIGKHVDGPVKVVWTREEDIQHDIYRPVYRDVISAALSGGKITAWKYRISGSSILARWLPPAFQGGIDTDAVDSAHRRSTGDRRARDQERPRSRRHRRNRSKRRAACLAQRDLRGNRCRVAPPADRPQGTRR